MAGTPQYIRNLNENLIMDALIIQGTMSRADISRQTGLSKPTVSLAVEHLIDRNLVREMGPADNAQGRKATLIRFNETAYYVCGIDIGATRIRIALSDLNGEIIAYRTYPMVVQEAYERAEATMLELLRSHMNELLDENHLNWDQIQCIGFGIPGVVLPESGRINRIVDPLAGLEEAFSLESLSGAFPCEVILENDVNLAALGEYRSGVAAGYPLFVFFSIGTGTGAGIMVHGQLLRGLGGLTGEIAEMLVDDGRRLEEVLSADGLMQLAKDYLDQHDELLLEAADSGADDLHRHLTPEKLFEAARSGEVEALDILQQYSQKIASALRQISVVLAPDLIVLGGGVGGNGDVLLPLLRQIISEQFPVQPQLICSKLGEQAVVTGAVQVAIQQTMLNLQQEAME
ncbi:MULTISPECIES: ROK family transcriptional regulator [Paenibacillus]|uniref:ROK family transcriptional regulator n=1 Tax=Paenibacillus TaxID=44249 RepID=UPI00209D02B2|nr:MULTISPECIES: ROK family protein [Paenibacillus]MCP1426467.1 putative NBD/HSP70 family sugar kinase [Paenibacillus xylanexedens]WFA87430.1 ROK family protein [Paenibacillus amylolyticus]